MVLIQNSSQQSVPLTKPMQHNEWKCRAVAIQHKGVLGRFMLAQTTSEQEELVQDLVKAEFGIKESSRIALTVPFDESDEEDVIVIPFQTKLLEQVVDEYPRSTIFGLRVYPRQLDEYSPDIITPTIQETKAETETVVSEQGDWQDEEYFDSYANLTIHQEMLQDTLRTTTYKRAIESVRDIKDKIVLDIGCGSGILSIFCAKAGAKHVYAIDASDIIEQARKTVSENGLDDKITLIRGKIEEITLPVDNVDMIVSEWMGTMLICESMIGSVLNARELFLAPKGLMLPATSDLFLVPVCLDKYMDTKIDFWDNVYGVSMSCLKAQAHKEFFSNPVFDRCIKEEDLLSSPVNVFHIDMHTDSSEVLERIPSEFRFFMKKDATLHGFGTWFDSGFIAGHGLEESEETVLSTSPFVKDTHWRNVTFVMEDQLKVNAGEEVVGSIVISRHKQWLRHFEVEISYSIPSRDIGPIRQNFPLWR